MFQKLKYFYYIFKWNRAIYTLTEFVLWYFIGIYIFSIPFNLYYFVFYCVIYLALFGLVYPIVYIYNDICDVEKDKLNKDRLKYKPFAAWKVSLHDFIWYGIIWIGLWLIIASFWPNILIFLLGIAILYNYFYTKYLKHIFVLENFANGITHSFIRFLWWIILSIQSLISISVDYRNISKEQILLLKQQLVSILSLRWLEIIAVIVILHYIILSIWSTYKRYMEFKVNKNSRKTLSKYTLSVFKKVIILLNLLYIIMLLFLLYLKFDVRVLLIWILWLLGANLAILRKKNKLLDKILIRLFAL